MDNLIENQQKYLISNNFIISNTFIDILSENITQKSKKLRRIQSVNDINYETNIESLKNQFNDYLLEIKNIKNIDLNIKKRYEKKKIKKKNNNNELLNKIKLNIDDKIKEYSYDNELLNNIKLNIDDQMKEYSQKLKLNVDTFKITISDKIKNLYKNERYIKTLISCMNKLLDNQLMNFEKNILNDLYLEITNNLEKIKKEKNYNLFFTYTLILEYKNYSKILLYFNKNPIHIQL
jgi:hypothetical protein